MENIKKIYRICDANLNRAKEGIRVVEDFLRFYLEDEDLMKKARDIRHGIGEVVSHELYEKLLAERNIFADHGMSLKEVARKDLQNVVLANLKRAQEAVRVLEEYFKIIAQDKAAALKDLRYKIYNLEKEISVLIKNHGFLPMC